MIYASKYLSDFEDIPDNGIVFYKVGVFNFRENINSPVLETIINNKLKMKYNYREKK